MKTIFLFLIITLCTTLHYPQVTEEWVEIYSGNVTATPFAMVTDEEGNVYITGGTVGTGIDFLTIKYNSAGVFQWSATYNGSANGHDVGHAITVDQAGNVYVTGESPGVISGFSSGLDYLTIKYDPQGNELWVQRYHGNDTFINGNLDSPNAIAIDPTGNVYVTGTSIPSGDPSGYGDFCTLMYSADGNFQWAARYNSGQPGIGQSVQVSSSGNVYVFGSSSSSTTPDYLTVKYNSSGTQQWSKRYSESTLVPSDMKIDDNENVYVTGEGGSPTGFHTLKYNSDGDSLWTAIYNGPSGLSVPSAIAVDGFGNVYVTGGSVNAPYTGQEYATVKYNSVGQEQWEARYDGLGDDQFVSRAEAITLDADGNVYVTGKSQGADFLQGDVTDYATVKYNNNGVEQWAVRYHRQPYGNEYAIGVGVDADGKVYVSGRGTITGGPNGIITIKYSQPTSDVSEINSEIPESFNLSQNYPNPFNPTTNIRWQSPVGSHQILKIYDVLGNEVATLVDEYLPAGAYETEFSAEGLSSGMYLYRLQAGSYIETKKMILLR